MFFSKIMKFASDEDKSTQCKHSLHGCTHLQVVMVLLMSSFIYPQRDDCGEPIDPNTLSCYRIDERGRKSMVPPIMCRYRSRPTRLPCTTPSSPTQSRPSTPRPPYSKSTVKAGSQKIQTNFSLLITLLALLLHLTKATTY